MYKMKPLVCVNTSYIHGNFSGTIQECREKEPTPFTDTMELIAKLEEYSNQYLLVMENSGCTLPDEQWMIGLDIRAKPGFMNFWIEILFCQHGTLQGSLSGISGKQFFRSDTELLLLMSNAYVNVRNETEGRRKRDT